MREDLIRLASGEPLAYVIGWIPFLGLSLRLDSHPLIPRPETEWWTEVLITHIREEYGNTPIRVLDLCAGSGAIGLAVLQALESAHVSFAELSPVHTALIAMNLDENRLDRDRADIRSGDLFAPFLSERFTIIATNPPYIPEDRELEPSVMQYEPHEALFAGGDGLSIIRRIVAEAPDHLLPGGELWMECDTSNAEQAGSLMRERGFSSVEIRNDHYGRPRIVVGYFA
jgi:release factor glutamine methyltransferase